MRCSVHGIAPEPRRRDLLRVIGLAICCAAVSALAVTPAGAQYSLGWFTIDGGGTTGAAGGSYTLRGTAGQPDAGFLTGSSYALSGGFWGSTNTTTGIVPDEPAGGAVPLAFRLHTAAPNPFSQRTSLAFDLPAASAVQLDVYDVAGRLVKTLARESLPAGSHERGWDRTDRNGRQVAAGIYFVRFDAGSMAAREKIVVLR